MMTRLTRASCAYIYLVSREGHHFTGRSGNEGCIKIARSIGNMVMIYWIWAILFDFVEQTHAEMGTE